MKKSGKSILYLTIIILSIAIFILIGIIINISNKEIKKQEKSESLQLGETTSNSTYVDINTHIFEVNNATKVEENEAIADNMTEGKQAWVNGKLITGNGADNQDYFERGYQQACDENCAGSDVVITRHQHSSACYCTGSMIVTEKNGKNGAYGVSGDNYAIVAVCNKCGSKGNYGGHSNWYNSYNVGSSLGEHKSSYAFYWVSGSQSKIACGINDNQVTSIVINGVEYMD